MQLTFKLFAGLGEFLPAEAKNNAILIEIGKNDSVFDVIAKFNIPVEMIHLVLLNGVYLHPHERSQPKFSEGDTLAIWPPVAGGWALISPWIVTKLSMSLVYEREMTITHKEFLRLLPKALRDRAYSQKGNEITVRVENNSVLINLSEQSIRKIASLELPVTTIRIELIGFEKNDSVNFMSRFDLAFQKGGGWVITKLDFQ